MTEVRRLPVRYFVPENSLCRAVIAVFRWPPSLAWRGGEPCLPSAVAPQYSYRSFALHSGIEIAALPCDNEPLV